MNNVIDKAVFGGVCFWCTEAVFKMLKGIKSVVPGYAGGKKENPTYEEVSMGNSGYAEVIRIEYEPSLIDYETLLTVFFATHDPTTLDKQGADVGAQYRSIIFYTNKEQKQSAQNFINILNASNEKGAAVVTQVEPLDAFFPAEEYHRDYYARNSQNSYCQVFINPKLKKVQEKFAQLLKETA